VGHSVADPDGVAVAVAALESFGLRGWAADGVSWTQPRTWGVEIGYKF